MFWVQSTATDHIRAASSKANHCSAHASRYCTWKSCDQTQRVANKGLKRGGLLSLCLLLLFVPAGLTSRGGAVVVYIFDITQASLPTPFSSVLVYFCLQGPFDCTSFQKFSRQLSHCSSNLISALLVLSTTLYLFMKVSFSPDIILCGCLGLKH